MGIGGVTPALKLKLAAGSSGTKPLKNGMITIRLALRGSQA
jgi:hypothetical protein